MSKKFPVDDQGRPVLLRVEPPIPAVLWTFEQLRTVRANTGRLRGKALRLGELTCDRCRCAYTCPYAMDSYNTKGDCLALK